MACRGDLKEEVERIRAALDMGYSASAVARTFGCSLTAVLKVRDGASYGAPPRRPGPKPKPREECDGVASAGAETYARTQRALAHWLKNLDCLSASEVADMYGVPEMTLHHARQRKERG